MVVGTQQAIAFMNKILLQNFFTAYTWRTGTSLSSVPRLSEDPVIFSIFQHTKHVKPWFDRVSKYFPRLKFISVLLIVLIVN